MKFDVFSNKTNAIIVWIFLMAIPSLILIPSNFEAIRNCSLPLLSDYEGFSGFLLWASNTFSKISNYLLLIVFAVITFLKPWLSKYRKTSNVFDIVSIIIIVLSIVSSVIILCINGDFTTNGVYVSLEMIMYILLLILFIGKSFSRKVKWTLVIISTVCFFCSLATLNVDFSFSYAFFSSLINNIYAIFVKLCVFFFAIVPKK